MSNQQPTNGNTHKSRHGEHLSHVEGPLVSAYLSAIDVSVRNAYPHASRAANMARLAMEQSVPTEPAIYPQKVSPAAIAAEVDNLAVLRAQKAVESALGTDEQGFQNAQEAA